MGSMSFHCLPDARGGAAKTSLTIGLEITMMGASSDFPALLIHSFDQRVR
jgi:hypothetical protein